MRICDLCGNPYSQEFSEKEGNDYFVGHYACVQTLVKLVRKVENEKAPKTGASHKGGVVK